MPSRFRWSGGATPPTLCLCLLVAVLLSPSSHPPKADDRSSFVISELIAHNLSLSDSARTEKYSEMSASAFAFYRGSAHLFWSDFGASSLLSTFGSSATRIFLQGDAHADNQGAFANGDGTIVYDLNDFDEAVIGDYQLDLFRLATSIVLIAHKNGRFSDADLTAIIDACSSSYLDTLGRYATNNDERTSASILTTDTAFGLLDEFLSATETRNSRKKLLDKYTAIHHGVRTFSFAHPDLQSVPKAIEQAFVDAIPAYSASLSGASSYPSGYFKPKSIAQRLHAGIGSLGMPRYYLLIEGPTASNDDDRILDVKAEETPSAYAVLAPALRALTESVSGGDAARRVALAARALGYRVDMHLGTLSILGQRFLVRERSPYKETFDTSELMTKTQMTKMATQWCATLATAHARADRDFDAATIPVNFEQEVLNLVSSRKSQFRARVRQVAISYATQVEADFQSFLNWFKP